MSSAIIFYDIPSQMAGNAWSPNTWKTRYALNIKGIPYKTEWVEYPDIAQVAKKIGAPPTGTSSDGSPSYTLPIIQDPNTGKVISDSFLIAEYLDETYPGGNVLFPPGTKPLMQALEHGVVGAIESLFLFQLALTCPQLNPPSEKYFRSTREAAYGMKIEEFSPEGAKREADWAKAKEGLTAVDRWLSKNGGGKYVMGDSVSYADGILAGWLIWIKITNEVGGAKWKEFASWHEGRWETYITSLEDYAAIN
ncbi:hypothetical protein F5I97DRAFT_1798953 [Phlebopus sp. FC_14]|nr:hypothetical protein F5I97DRAFT_1798953 [Phlebopus sp. FC_14]